MQQDFLQSLTNFHRQFMRFQAFFQLLFLHRCWDYNEPREMQAQHLSFIKICDGYLFWTFDLGNPKYSVPIFLTRFCNALSSRLNFGLWTATSYTQHKKHWVLLLSFAILLKYSTHWGILFLKWNVCIFMNAPPPFDEVIGRYGIYRGDTWSIIRIFVLSFLQW